MAYEPLHHKYRPQTFNDLVGQVAISNTLINAIKLEKIAPAYLFTGPRGTGKTSSARILAKSLNCLNSNQPTADPCGKCDVCQAIANGNALDVIEIDAASNTGVDNIREIIERSRFAPVQSRFKVYAIDECHMLSTAAFNALLKTLEEPPPQVVFILATTDPQRVLPTIISRCQRFDYRRIPIDSMVGHLQYIAKQEKIDITTEALTLNAQIANGGLRDAESLLDQLSLLPNQITVTDIWDLVGAVPEQDLLSLLIAIRKQSIEEILTQCRNLLDRGKEPLVLLQSLASFYLNLLTAKTTPQRQDLVAITETCWQQLLTEAEHWQVSEILGGQQQLKNAENQIKHSTQPRLWLEVTLLNLLEPNLVATASTQQTNRRGFTPAKPQNLSSPNSQPTQKPVSASQKVQPLTSNSAPQVSSLPTNYQTQEASPQIMNPAAKLQPQAPLQQPLTQSPQLESQPNLVSTQPQPNINPVRNLDLEPPSQPTTSDLTNQAEAIANPSLFDTNKGIVAPSPQHPSTEQAQPQAQNISPVANPPAKQTAPEQQPVSSSPFTNNPQPQEVSPAKPITTSAPQELVQTTEVASPSTPLELTSGAEKVSETRPAEIFPEIDCEEIWQQVVKYAQPVTTQALIRQHCHLIDLTNSVATVGITSAPLQKMSQGKIPNMEAAFAKVCDRKIKVILEVSKVKKNSSPKSQVSVNRSNSQSNFNDQPPHTPANIGHSSPNNSTSAATIQAPAPTALETPPAISVQTQLEISPVSTASSVLEKPPLPDRRDLASSSPEQPELKPQADFSNANLISPTATSGDFNKAVELVAKKFEGEVIELESSFPLPASNDSELSEVSKPSNSVPLQLAESNSIPSVSVDFTPNIQPVTSATNVVTSSTMQSLVATQAIATNTPQLHNSETSLNHLPEPPVTNQQPIAIETNSVPNANSQPRIIIKREATSSYDYDDEDIPF